MVTILIIMNNHGKIKKAVEKGNFEKYNFQIREKVYQLFSGEDYVVTNHYIEIAGMYVPIRENLITGLECWQTISVVLVEYKGTYYFSYLNENVFYNDTEDSLWWNDLSRKRHTNSTNKWRNSYEGSNRDIEGIFEAAWKWRTAGNSKKRFCGSI